MDDVDRLHPGDVLRPDGWQGDDQTLFVVAWSRRRLLGGLVAFILPWRLIIESRWRELAFLHLDDARPRADRRGGAQRRRAQQSGDGAVLRADRVRRRVVSDVVGEARGRDRRSRLRRARGDRQQSIGRAVLVLGGLGGAATISCVDGAQPRRTEAQARPGIGHRPADRRLEPSRPRCRGGRRARPGRSLRRPGVADDHRSRQLQGLQRHERARRGR